MKEFDFIRQYLYHQKNDNNILLGIGDDAAIIRPKPNHDLCFSSDMLINNRHFFANVAPSDLAHKVLAVNISDMAAMGATPRWVLLSVALPELEETWLTAFCDHFFALAKQFDITLIGGDTTKGDFAFNVTIIGELPEGKALRRDAAQTGDDIWVSGKVGLAAAALNHHWGKVALPPKIFDTCEQSRLRPTPRVALGQAILPFAHAAQDISDGLAQDLGHILKASEVGADIFADSLPTLPALYDVLEKTLVYDYTLAGGDDYELVFTAPEACRNDILNAAQISHTPVTHIGKITQSGHLNIFDANGEPIQLNSLGFDHFG
ncbi:thiamine-phosphate kinase [Neisseria montereyensis]|uniref:Thiamine-monophosphate kinase n=1 Tax=Neisseria montereyensis TaxID=2973938 RepID=A0ABT2FEQ8_9NEIS|nr:thiamine-phosphate kinase [Neisseria montereyensis]MCS4534702.1 thiamine-phosphate kinase [Neisseria montereyensis]